jgi:hypothetical protein
VGPTMWVDGMGGGEAGVCGGTGYLLERTAHRSEATGPRPERDPLNPGQFAVRPRGAGQEVIYGHERGGEGQLSRIIGRAALPISAI